MNLKDTFPEFCYWLTRRPAPHRGGGLNNWLLIAARQLSIESATVAEAKEILEAIAQSHGGARPGEIDRQVMTAYETQPPKRTAPRWRKNDPILSAAAQENKFTVQQLIDSSPWDQDVETEQAIDTLFPGDPLLTCGFSEYKFDTRLRSEWRGIMHSMEFIVPSPAIARTGKTKEGKESAHCLEIMGPRRYVVIEFDDLTWSQQSSTIKYLADRYGGLVMVVFSGHRSLHAWFRSAGSEDQDYIFMSHAVACGACIGPWLKCQFVRMPGARPAGANPFDSAKLQPVLYFAPSEVEDQQPRKDADKP